MIHTMTPSSEVGVGCRMHPIQRSWFEFPAWVNQAFHPSALGEMVLGSPGNDRTQTAHRWQPKSLYTPSTYSNCFNDIA